MSRPFPIECQTAPRNNTKLLTKRCSKNFWQQTGVEAYAEKQGCYVFAIKAGRGHTPWYVGKSTKGFKQECFTPHKLGKYNEALFQATLGTPVLFFVAPGGNKKKVPPSTVRKVETFLIQNAYAQNQNLTNDLMKKGPEWRIEGIVRAGKGKPSDASISFAKMMGL